MVAVMVAVGVSLEGRRPWAGPCLPRAASRPAGLRPDRSPRVLGVATGPSEAEVCLGPARLAWPCVASRTAGCAA